MRNYPCTKTLSKIKVLTEIVEMVETPRGEGKVIVLTNGCFDLLHIGHIRLLEKAKKLGNILIVAINTDRTIKKLKGNARPIINQADRLEMVASLEMVDFVVLFDELTPVSVIKTLQPDIFVKGSGYSPEQLPEYPAIQEYGGKVITFGPLAPISTSSIIQKIHHS